MNNIISNELTSQLLPQHHEVQRRRRMRPQGLQDHQQGTDIRLNLTLSVTLFDTNTDPCNFKLKKEMNILLVFKIS